MCSRRNLIARPAASIDGPRLSLFCLNKLLALFFDTQNVVDVARVARVMGQHKISICLHRQSPAPASALLVLALVIGIQTIKSNDG